MKVINGEGLILGRLAAYTAKQLLLGEEVVIVNAEKTMISGKLEATVGKYKSRYEQIDKANPDHSPKWPRRPDMLFKRIVRGMLPWKRKPHGRVALKRLRVYMGVPKEFESAEGMPAISAANTRMKSWPLETVSRRLGWSG